MSLNAVPFYARAGFRPYGDDRAGRLTTRDGEVDVPILRMEKRLPQPAESAASGLWSARRSL